MVLTKGRLVKGNSTQSKMRAMKLPLLPGADPHSIRPYAKRFTPPMKEEMRTQVNKMLKYAVCQRGDGNTVVSNVHLARKPEKPAPLPGAEPQRPAWRRTAILVTAGVLLILAAIGGALLAWITSQWYVGSYQGNVAIYQGVPGNIGPFNLQRLNLETGTAVASLPEIDQQRVEQSILVDSQEQAVNTVAQLDQKAQKCASDAPPEGCPQPPSQGSGAP